MSIEEWQEMFSVIFSASLRHLSLEEVAAHLMEELGEASDAMVRMYSYKAEIQYGEPGRRQLRLESQLADLFSWLFALVGKLNLREEEGLNCERPNGTVSSGPEPIRLSDIIWRRYGSEDLHAFYCPFCEHAVCSCLLLFVPATAPSEELLKKISGYGR